MEAISTAYFQELFRFTNDDLEFNRAGRLSPAQYDQVHVKREFRAAREAMTLGGGCLLPFTLMTVGAITRGLGRLNMDIFGQMACWNSADGPSCASGGCLVAVIFIAALMLFALGLIRSILLRHPVRQVDGVFKLWKETDQEQEHFGIVIKGERIEIPETAYNALINVRSATIRAYYFALIPWLLSAEVVES